MTLGVRSAAPLRWFAGLRERLIRIKEGKTMVDFRYGPVELFLLGLEGERPDPAVIAELVALSESGVLRVLDFVVVSRSEDGEVTVTEIEDDSDRYGLGALDLVLTGLTGQEDIAELAELVPAGGSAALVALELLYARRLAGALAATGGLVLSAQRIPAPIVNAIVDAIEDEVDEEIDAIENEGEES